MIEHPKPYDKLPEEQPHQWLAFQCYRDLGELRTYDEAYKTYLQKRQKPHKGGRASSTWRRWSQEFNWFERAEAWDVAQEAMRREKAEAEESAKYLEQLEEFRKTQLNAGKTGLAIALTVKNKLVRFLKDVDNIKSWKEAEIAARLLSAVEDKSSEQWAKALHVDLLLEEMMKNDG